MDTKKPAPPTEEREQAELVSWFKREYGEDAAERLHHSPNGGHRNKATAGRLRLMGVRRGFPDLVLYLRRGPYTGCAVEMKPTLPKRYASAEQKQWIEWLADCGFYGEVADGLEDAQRILAEYMRGEA